MKQPFAIAPWTLEYAEAGAPFGFLISLTLSAETRLEKQHKSDTYPKMGQHPVSEEAMVTATFWCVARFYSSSFHSGSNVTSDHMNDSVSTISLGYI